jgi:hypothetical protein
MKFRFIDPSIFEMSLFEGPGSKLLKKERHLLEYLLLQITRYEASMRIPADKAKTQLLKNADTS